MKKILFTLLSFTTTLLALAQTMGKLYKRYKTTTSNTVPYPLPFSPETTDLKNGIVQFFVGYRF